MGVPPRTRRRRSSVWSASRARSAGQPTGSLVLQHVGTFDGGAATATLTVVSGTDELKGRHGGRAKLVADPSGPASPSPLEV